MEKFGNRGLNPPPDDPSFLAVIDELKKYDPSAKFPVCKPNIKDPEWR
jgi:hypothetical protein